MAAFDLAKLLPQVVQVALHAGEAIKTFGRTHDELNVRSKQDNTPQTAADLCSQEVIVRELEQLSPRLPILSEEAMIPDYNERQQWQTYWLVDPLDGTRGFIHRSHEFTVNIALVHQHRPVLGVLNVPMLDVCYYAAAGGGAFKLSAQNSAEPIQAKSLNWQRPRIIMGRYHTAVRTERILQQFPDYELVKCNSAFKLGLIAEGESDIYLRFGPTSEWDIAAGQCILQEAGGIVTELSGDRLRYNTRPSLRNPEFVALGDCNALDRVLNFIKTVRREE